MSTSPCSPDVAIVGGGIIGCAIAWHLARAGARVTVVERGQVGAEASSAAAGMLAPLAEGITPGPFLDLLLASLARYPALADALRDEAGIDIELRTDGLLRLALTEQEAGVYRAALEWQRARGLPVQWLSASELRALVPAASPAALGAVLSLAEHQVNAPRLTAALATAAARRGVALLERTPAHGLLRQGQRVTGVRLANRALTAGHVVLAAGAWAGELAAWIDRPVPVAPVRGQMLALRPATPLFAHTLYGPRGYLVPKLDGTVYVGATVEEAGFDCRVTAAGLAQLLELAVRLAPPLADATFVRAWAGLRPGSPDHQPILGPVPGLEGVSLAVGHFRNGILLAPITGELLAQHVLGQPTTLPLAPFSLARFTDPAATAHPMPPVASGRAGAGSAVDAS
ncbi:MAG: glycine oxidase ThiO [Chloroflexi bacterium]|nr:glycine oxidase ThiO [Chloroflexota bacterium]